MIGHDWGGWTALLLGMLHPERVDRMIVCNVPHPWPRRSPRHLRQTLMSWYALANATPGLGPFLHQHTPWIAYNLGRGAGGALTGGEIVLFAERYRDPGRALAAGKLYRYYLRTFAESLAGRWDSTRLHAPTRLIFGERDVFISPELVRGDSHRSHSDDMEIEFVPGSGHFVVDERPDLIVARAAELFGGAAQKSS